MALSERDTPQRSLARLSSKMVLARLALAWERLWPTLWPAAAAVGLFLALALFDVLPALPGWLHAAVLAALGGGFLYAAGRAARLFAWPVKTAARRRLETASGLEHRPLAAVEDSLAAGGGNPESAALWRVHQQRMADAIRALKVGPPSPGLARRDPVALRALLAAVLLVAVAVGWSDGNERLARALTPSFGAGGGAPALAFDLWITPPDYTRLAPIFPLRVVQKTATPGTGAPAATGAGEQSKDALPRRLSVPAGSVLTAQVQGARGAVQLVLGRAAAKPAAAGNEPPADKGDVTGDVATVVDFEKIDPTYSRITHAIEAAGTLAVRHGGGVLGEWTLDIIPDKPPTIAFADDPGGTPQATLRLAYTASDDYGIVKARAEFRRTYEHGAVTGKEVVTLDLPMPNRNAKAAREQTYLDLAPHKWAGLPVVMRLIAVDARGQTGYSDAKLLTLPERQFLHPVARAIIEQRKRLARTPEDRQSVFDGLGEIASVPGAFGHDTVVFLALSSARARLGYDRGKEAIDPILNLLWDTALRVEDGGLSVAERELRRIQQQLMKALAEGAPDAELERLMRELRMAMNRFLRELAEQMRRNPQNQQQVMEFDPNTMRLIRSEDLARMLDQIRDLMRSGARQAAREMLARLQQMLQGMRSMQVMRMRGGQMGRGQGMLRQLQDLIRRQQQLMEQTFRNGRQGQGRPQGGMPGAADQRALQQLLRQLRGMMPGQGQQGPGQFLNRADQAMERAIRALEGGQPNEATGAQGRALDALRRAGRAALQQMMERFARESGMRGNRQQDRQQPRRDPLGREVMGEDMDTSDVKIPDASAIQRAREILEELRRRSGQIYRPRLELDYIERLLDRF